MTKASDIRITPDWLLDIVREFAGGAIALDLCTQADNPARAYRFYTEDDDGLSMSWASALRQMPLHRDWLISVGWGNVPYSAGQVIRWATKVVHEAREGADILLLTKDDCRTRWNRFLVQNVDARCRIAKGVGFLQPDGEGGYEKLSPPRWGECLWYFGRNRRRFARVFGGIGEVIHGLGPVEVQP